MVGTTDRGGARDVAVDEAGGRDGLVDEDGGSC